MPTDYNQIAAENIKGYGTNIDHYGPLLLANRYSDRTHFVYELLQNAEDAIGWRIAKENSFPRDVSFELRKDLLVVRHFGMPFNEKFVRAICSIGEGTKQSDFTTIGRFGIGFKSVFAYSNRPEVHSADEHFVIESYVRPRAIPDKHFLNGATSFVLPFDHPDVSSEVAYSEIAKRLQALGLKTLLFLRNIDSINWTLACGKSGRYLRKTKQIAKGIDRVTLVGRTDSAEEEIEEWLIFRKPVENNGQPAGFAEVAFCIEKDEKSDDDQIAAVPESPLVVFFPTEKETHFGFLIQGPYRTTPSRDNIPKDDPWNKKLALRTAEVLKWALICLRNQKLTTVRALEALVVDCEKYEEDTQAELFYPIVDAIIESLKTEKLIPGFRGGHLTGSAACIARTEGLRTLISHSQLAEVTGSKAGWVTGEITYNRTPALRSFLIDSIGVKEFDGEDLIREMSDEFLCNQSDEWLAKFYAFLLDQHTIQRQYWFASKAIVRLKTGKHVAVFGPNRTPNAYLPSLGRTEFPTVKKSLCNGDSLKFLQQIGLTPPDPVDDVIHNVLPKYKREPVEADGAEYDEDIRRILEAFKTDSKVQKEKLLAALRNTTFIMSVDVGDGKKYVSQPGEVYLATDRLKKLFAGVPNVMLVDDEYECLRGEDIRELLEACGASRQIRPVQDSSLSWQELQELRVRSGYPATSFKNDRVSDWSLEGLPGLMAALLRLSLPERKERARLLWEELAHLEERRGKGVFNGEYTWTHHGQRRAPPFDAEFIRKLNATAWIPDSEGNLRFPESIMFDSLGWKPNPFLQSKIRFKPPIVEILAKEVGIEPGILDLLKKHGLTSVAELSSRLGINERNEGEDGADSEIADYGDGELKRVEGDDDFEDWADTVDDEVEGNDVEETDDTGDLDDENNAILGDARGPTLPDDAPTSSKPPGGGSGNDSGKGGAVRAKGSIGDKDWKNGGKQSNKDAKGNEGSKQGSSTKPFISYVATHPHEENPDPDGVDQQARMALEEQAIQLILANEPQLKRAPPNNPGFDLFEVNNEYGPSRKVEVKAMIGDLCSRPVGLSRTQFECAQREGRVYWLYIVEHAGAPERSRIVRIQDPAGKACTFCFDHGWLGVADIVEARATVPTAHESYDL